MVKRITVSVSDDLGERIAQWKDKLSPSTVFQAAMEKAISEKEGFIKRLQGEKEGMEQIIERLRAEKAEDENNSYREGQEEGLEWAKAASYSELRYAAEIFNPYESNYEVKEVYYDEVLGHYFVEALDNNPMLKPGDGEDYFSVAGDKWIEGWLEGVSAFWKEVSRELNS